MSISRGVWKGHVIKLANKTEKIKIMETISLKTSSLSAEGFFSGDIFEGDSRKVDAPKTQKIGGSLEIEQIEGRRWKTGCTRGGHRGNTFLRARCSKFLVSGFTLKSTSSLLL